MKDKALSLLGDLRRYWKKPPRGRYMTFKEIVSLSVGGIGVKFIVYCISQMILSVGNTLIGNTIGIDPSALYVIYIVSVLSGFPLTAIRAKMIDNTRSMKGKYRPYLLTMGVPTVILGVLFIWTPYERMTLFMKCAAVLAYNIGFQFFFNFYNDSYDSLINVLSPNSIERSDVLSVRSVVENFSPSLANIFLPIAAKLITGSNTLYDIRIYRALFPPMLLAGFAISMLVYVNTEEKIVQAKTHVIRLKFTDAFRAIARNKYFWIISLAGWLGFLEGSFNSIMGWMYNYRQACSPAQYSVITAIAGNASFWPNLVAPFFIRRYGKKKILIFTNLLNIIFIIFMLPIVRNTGSKSIIWLLLGCTFVNQFITSLGHLLTPSVNADIRDYQQYVTGERIDGMFAAVGLIGNVITLATSGVLPVLYERSGLNAATAVSLGYSGSNVYDVLYNAEYFVKISSVLVMASVLGAVMNVIPYFFYDLSETRQKAMVRVLKIRAAFEDLGNGAASDEALAEAGDLIEETLLYAEKAPSPIEKDADKKTLKLQREENEKIEIAGIVLQELNRYKGDAGKIETELAQRFADAGLNGFSQTFTMTRAEVKAMPKGTPLEKERRRDLLTLISQIRASEKAAAKYYPNGVTPFDASVFEILFNEEYENEAALRDTLQSLKQAREMKNAPMIDALKNKVRDLQRQKAEIGRKIKQATAQNSVYYRAAKPYLDARRTLVRANGYADLNAFLALAAAAKERIAAKE